MFMQVVDNFNCQNINKYKSCPDCDMTKNVYQPRWKNKMWYIHTMRYYSAIKRNKVHASKAFFEVKETSHKRLHIT